MVFFVIDKMIDKLLMWLGYFFRIIKVYPINEQGENIFKLEKSDDPKKTEKFLVIVHFNLWTKYQVELINIDLTYIENAFTSSKDIQINNKPVNTDNSFRICHSTNVSACGTVNIRLVQKFVCNYDEAKDYQTVTIKFEAASALWSGIKKILITGKLSAGGELNNIRIRRV